MDKREARSIALLTQMLLRMFNERVDHITKQIELVQAHIEVLVNNKESLENLFQIEIEIEDAGSKFELVIEKGPRRILVSEK